MGWLVESFQSSNHAQEFQSIAADQRFDVFSNQAGRTIRFAQHETPMTLVCLSPAFRVKVKFVRGLFHSRGPTNAYRFQWR